MSGEAFPEGHTAEPESAAFHLSCPSLVCLVALQLSPWRALRGADEHEFIRAMPLPSSGWCGRRHTLEVDSEKGGRYTALFQGPVSLSVNRQPRRRNAFCLRPSLVPVGERVPGNFCSHPGTSRRLTGEGGAERYCSGPEANIPEATLPPALLPAERMGPCLVKLLLIGFGFVGTERVLTDSGILLGNPLSWRTGRH